MDENLVVVESPRKIVWLALLFEGALLVVACIAGVFMARPPWQQFVWTASDAATGVIATLPMLLGLVALRRARRGGLGRLNRVVDQHLLPLFAGCTLTQLGLISLLAGVGEEFLFRGVIQPKLADWFGEPAGLTVTSLAFGLLHAITPTYAILATGVGAYLGWLALATDNLLPPIVTHALYDWFALWYLCRARG